METIEEFELFGNDGNRAAFHLTDEFSNVGVRSVNMIQSDAFNENKISLPIWKILTGWPIKWIDGNSIIII